MSFTFEFVKNFILEKGYTLISTEYTSSQIPLDIKCPKDHLIHPSFSEFKRKARCNNCSGNRKPTLKEIQLNIENKGFTLLSTNYINNSSKLDIKCSKGHIWQCHWNNLKNGNGCPDCYGNRRYTVEQVSSYVENFNYKVKDSTYRGLEDKLNLVCPKGHNYVTRFHDFKNGNSRCGHCSHQTSKAEQEILDFVQQYYPSAKKVKFYEIDNNYPKENRNKELDIYIPELNLAIEYCGLFWHSEASGPKKSDQHRNKLTLCRQNKIRLITIFEDEWLTRKEQVKNLLMSVMQIHNIKIGARKCCVKEIDKMVAKRFIDSQHIQGLYMCTIAFGLFFNNELIGVITGSPHHRQNQSGFVLQRLCFKQGVQVPGGASRLLKALVKHSKALGYNQMVSWSDNRISEGNVYQKLGFSLKTEYDHDYSYVLNGVYNKRHSKQSLKKTPEERLTRKTEWELRKEQGYYRIWDCGKKVWTLIV